MGIGSLAQVEVSAESLGAVAEGIDISDNYGDAEYVETESRNKLAHFVNIVNGPEDLELIQLGKVRKAWRRRITDMDGDGVEDNEKYSHDLLDEFYDPLVFGVAEDINNTPHGKLPGHKQLEFEIHQTEPVNHWQDIVQAAWPIK